MSRERQGGNWILMIHRRVILYIFETTVNFMKSNASGRKPRSGRAGFGAENQAWVRNGVIPSVVSLFLVLHEACPLCGTISRVTGVRLSVFPGKAFSPF